MSFLRNSAFNFLGGLLPAVAVFVSIPLIVNRLGTDAYGALVLITSIVGYFGIIDVNATAGSVKYVAEHRARGEEDNLARVVSLGMLLYLAIGLLGCVALSVSADVLVNRVFRIDLSWRAEAKLAIQISAFAFLFGQIQQYLQSIPQALQRFDINGQFDALFGSLSPIATIGVVLAGGGLVEIVVARLALSVLHCAVLVVVVRRLLPMLRLRRPDRDTTRKVATFSAYAYLQRIAAVTYLNADKLLIGAQQSMATLATYVIPYTLVSRLYSLLYRLMQGVFPMASALQAVGDLHLLRDRFKLLMRYSMYLNVCLCLLLAVFAQELLHFWLHTELDRRASIVLVIVAFSLLAESITNVPSLVNDGLGKPQITASAAILRVVFSVTAAWAALTYSGIVAMALSQLAITVLVAVGFVWYVHRSSFPWRLSEVAGYIYGPSAVMLAIGCAIAILRFQTPLLRWWDFVLGVTVALSVLLIYGWFFVLERIHRRALVNFCQQRLARA